MTTRAYCLLGVAVDRSFGRFCVQAVGVAAYYLGRSQHSHWTCWQRSITIAKLEPIAADRLQKHTLTSWVGGQMLKALKRLW
jgi:hypothetical protein